MANLSELNEAKPAKKAKTGSKKAKAEPADDIDAMLMATEGKQRLSDKENQSPVKEEPKKRTRVKKGKFYHYFLHQN